MSETETEAAPDRPADRKDAASADPLARAIGRLDFALTPQDGRVRIGAGELAALRRMAPWRPDPPPAFWRALFAHVPEELRRGAARERAWAVVINAMARLAPEPHNHHAPLGAVLAGSDDGRGAYSEPRFVRLLRAEGEDFVRELGVACRWLAARGRSVDCIDLARFVLTRLAERPSDRDENNTRRLARRYFETKDRQSRPTAA